MTAMSHRSPIDLKSARASSAACFAAISGRRPITVAQTRRVLLAKQLIHQTDLPHDRGGAGQRFWQRPAF